MLKIPIMEIAKLIANNHWVNMDLNILFQRVGLN
jgi:hypothetical protein